MSIKSIASRFGKIEESRKTHTKNPGALIEGDSTIKHARELYDYISAYKASGAIRTNIESRQEYIQKCLQ